MSFDEYVESLVESSAAREAAFEYNRLWRAGWDVPGSSGYQSFIMAHRRMRDLFPSYEGGMSTLAVAIVQASMSKGVTS